MAKSGAYPVNPATSVGQVRLNFGDSTATLVSGAAPEYAYYSDAEITAFLTSAGGDVVRATGYAFLQLAAALAIEGESIKTDDLALNTLGRGSDLRQVAESWFKQADAASSTAADDFFDVVAPFETPNVGWC